jgi:hypothetical protein
MRTLMKPLSPILRQIECADARALQQAYQHVADAHWVDGCTVDVPNLVLEVRAKAPWTVRSALEAQLEQVARIARGQRELP